MKCAVADVGLVCQAFPVSPSIVPNFLIAVANYLAEAIQGNRAFWFMVQEYSPSWWLEWLWLEPWMHVAAAYYNDTCQQAQRAEQEVGPPITLKSCPLGYLLPAAKPLRAPLPPQLPVGDCVQMQEPVGMLHLQMPLLVGRSLVNAYGQGVVRRNAS